MNFSKKIFVLSIFVIFISLCAAYSAYTYQNNDAIPVVSNETDVFGCCSIVLQLDGNETLMSYRRDSNVTADVFIEKIDWHGHPAVKQYKTKEGYFNHVIVTNDGWVIGLGGIDDGIDSELCENITALMISDDFKISKKCLSKIQNIKKQYGRGHVVIKAPNGNYGFATTDKLKISKLKPGDYISIPNDYSLSRGGNVSLPLKDKIKTMTKLAQSDLYGLDRREIITYDVQIGNESNITDIYASNEDGSLVGANYKNCIDNIIFNNNLTEGKNIPLAPDYMKLGSVSFDGGNVISGDSIVKVIIVGVLVFIGILFYVLLKLVRIIRLKIRR